MNNHLHRENAGCLVTSALHLNHRLNTYVLAQEVSAPEQRDRKQKMLKPLWTRQVLQFLLRIVLLLETLSCSFAHRLLYM